MTGDHMIGNNPNRIAHTVMIFRPNTAHRAFDHRVVQIAHVVHASFSFEMLPGMIEVQEHHDASFGIETCERDESDPDGHAHIVTEQPKEPERAD